MNGADLIPVLQAAISPVVLMSGVGLLILSMTNRLARVVDRSRRLGEIARAGTDAEKKRAEPQLVILVKRARLMRRAIFFSTLSVLIAAVLIIVLFLLTYLRLDATFPGVALFVLCLSSLIIALVTFLQDIHVSLVALDMELEREAHSI